MTATTSLTSVPWVHDVDAPVSAEPVHVAPAELPLVPAPQNSGWQRRSRQHRAALVAGDVFASLVGTGVGVAFAQALDVDPIWAAAPLALAPATVVMGGVARLAVDRGASLWQAPLRGAGLAVLILAVVAAALGVVLPLAVVGLFLLAAGLGAGLRVLSARRLLRRRRNGIDRQRTLVIAASDTASDYVARVTRHPEDGIDLVGQLRVPRRQGAMPLPFLGALGELTEVVAAHEIDLVVVVGALPAAEMRKVIWAMEETRADLMICPGLAEVGSHRLGVMPTTRAWNGLVAIKPRPMRDILKAVIDRVLGLVLLLVATPIIAVFGLAVLLTSPGGAFYSQIRVGKNGKHFRMWKLRSMCKEADAQRAALVADENDGNGIMYVRKDDPRVTTVGKFIRRYSIDELPQLWNVVRGDMSLIGPRPALPEEVAEYEDIALRRLLVTPGLTGLWQVSGRSDLSWERTVELDLRYVDNHSFALDAKVMAATGGAVFGASGAY